MSALLVPFPWKTFPDAMSVLLVLLIFPSCQPSQPQHASIFPYLLRKMRQRSRVCLRIPPPSGFQVPRPSRQQEAGACEMVTSMTSYAFSMQSAATASRNDIARGQLLFGFERQEQIPGDRASLVIVPQDRVLRIAITAHHFSGVGGSFSNSGHSKASYFRPSLGFPLGL